ncbi:hypothetical protein QSJ18_04675 [Gordonia sp. ABSL1-1]|uniref:hypothetical protein n=1 Tax=Gordonia sp. ABSL1-1 TaxID=3053923 RepID=UPI002572E113|nr:hypothetical protein [Gordonia sp. ABSL1-1]MDL9936030.1 hypothetical protein [Gordonia sp. ABSL1-1]
MAGEWEGQATAIRQYECLTLSEVSMPGSRIGAAAVAGHDPAKKSIASVADRLDALAANIRIFTTKVVDADGAAARGIESLRLR